MDKEKEVFQNETLVLKRFELSMLIEEALKAERTKREEAEKKYQDHRDATLDGDCQICDYEGYNAKIKKLEAKVKELDRFIDDLSFGRQDASLSQIYFYKKCSMERLQENKDLESQLATANTKIVELENHPALSDLNRWNLAEEVINLRKQVRTANKKAEKLVEHLKELCNAVATMNFGKNHAVRVKGDDEPVYQQRHEWCAWIFEIKSRAEQALKEYRGES